jgi:hypothetical protein
VSGDLIQALGQPHGGRVARQSRRVVEQELRSDGGSVQQGGQRDRSGGALSTRCTPRLSANHIAEPGNGKSASNNAQHPRTRCAIVASLWPETPKNGSRRELRSRSAFNAIGRINGSQGDHLRRMGVTTPLSSHPACCRGRRVHGQKHLDVWGLGLGID